ncbi:YihY/virulence factor BrkB family protein [Corallococcus sp. M34]|uniref:YihY/virulence factor BrkB family protein n=1 Tax=Citreicoccus inhibens TaxID=2849499 RepID=UPI001C238133|nr:YihY/virulence factor BrkB family protein [Citreicoccus inhibens]MBU8900777.1 YihY/virulence factor BrkB family protein [Citreicoccus inhibens]
MDGVSRCPAGKEASGSDRSPVETRREEPVRRAQWRGVLARLRQEWKRNKLSNAAAALTFYGVLAVFPFLLFIVALAGLVIQPAQVQAIIGALGREVPPAFSQLLYAQLAQLTSMPSSRLLTFSALASVWSAAAGVVSLIEALNTAYSVTESRPLWKVYGIALGMMLATAILAVLAGLITVAAPALAARFGPPWTTLVGWLRLPIAALLMMMLWATLYSVLPDARQRFKLITPGSVVGVLVWLTASLGFSFYVSHFSTFGITYGALGGIIVLLLWMWISSLALILGAEVNAVLARHPAGAKSGARLRSRRRRPPGPTQSPVAAS